MRSPTGAGGKAKLVPTKQNPHAPASVRDPGSPCSPWGALPGAHASTHLLFLMGERQRCSPSSAEGWGAQALLSYGHKRY